MAIEDLAALLAKEKHLPNVPPASESKANGLNLGEFQMKLLEKIEELTLYTLQQARAIQQKTAEIEDLRAQKNSEIAALKSEGEALSTRLAEAEKMMKRLAAEVHR